MPEQTPPPEALDKSRYTERLGEMLIEHMAQGYSFTSFSAVVDIPYTTLHDWFEKTEKSKKIKLIAEAKSRHYWETIGIASSQGQLRRVTKETVRKTTLYDANGTPQKNPDGTPAVREDVIDRSYEPIPLAQSMWIFVMKSRFGYRDDGSDHFNPENQGSGATKKFQLAYNLKDPAYVVKSRPQGDKDGKQPANDNDPGKGPDQPAQGPAPQGSTGSPGKGA